MPTSVAPTPAWKHPRGIWLRKSWTRWVRGASLWQLSETWDELLCLFCFRQSPLHMFKTQKHLWVSEDKKKTLLVGKESVVHLYNSWVRSGLDCYSCSVWAICIGWGLRYESEVSWSFAHNPCLAPSDPEWAGAASQGLAQDVILPCIFIQAPFCKLVWSSQISSSSKVSAGSTPVRGVYSAVVIWRAFPPFFHWIKWPWQNQGIYNDMSS